MFERYYWVRIAKNFVSLIISVCLTLVLVAIGFFDIVSLQIAKLIYGNEFSILEFAMGSDPILITLLAIVCSFIMYKIINWVMKL